MSDRMPEDLPVRKCINVMVGITRSKVIFLFNITLKFAQNSGTIPVTFQILISQDLWRS